MLPYILAAARVMSKLATYHMTGRIIYGLNQGLLYSAKPNYRGLLKTDIRSHMDLVFRRFDGSHVSVDTVHPSLLRSSSLSSPWWCHLQSRSSCVVLVSPLYVSKPPQSRFPVPLCDTLYLQSLCCVFLCIHFYL